MLLDGALLDGVLLDGALGAGALGAAVVVAAAAVAPPPLSPEVLDATGVEAASAFLFEEPEYRSEYHPEPLSMKLPDVMRREAASAPHRSHTLVASSVIRCTLSKVFSQAEQRYV